MSLTVLIIDDDDVFIFLHNLSIVESGIATETINFDGGRKALAYLMEQMPVNQPCFIFLDINMPIMDGWQFLEALQTLPGANQVFVALVTSSINSSDHEKAKLYPQVIDFIEKPLNQADCERILNMPQVKNFIAG